MPDRDDVASDVGVSSPVWRWSGAAILFDLDGTLADSSASVIRAWQWVADSLGQPYASFEPYIHGIPAPQVFDLVVGSLDSAERDQLIEAMLARQALDDDVVAVPGAAELLDGLATSRWAIVTSGDRRLATARIEAAGLPLPRVLVTADDVSVGKPDAEPYLLAARRLGVSPSSCLVVEDSVAGVSSGRAAGMPVLGVLTAGAPLDGVDHSVSDLADVRAIVDQAGVHVEAL